MVFWAPVYTFRSVLDVPAGVMEEADAGQAQRDLFFKFDDCLVPFDHRVFLPPRSSSTVSGAQHPAWGVYSHGKGGALSVPEPRCATRPAEEVVRVANTAVS